MPVPAIDASEVQVMFAYCHHKESLPPGETVKVKGIINWATFMKDRLEANREKITKMIQDLHPMFKREEGSSFRFATQDFRGDEWTEFHAVAEMLALMGVALGIVEFSGGEPDWQKIPNEIPKMKVLV